MDSATTYDELKDAISDAYPTLSPQLQRLARYALDRPQTTRIRLGALTHIPVRAPTWK